MSDTPAANPATPPAANAAQSSTFWAAIFNAARVAFNATAPADWRAQLAQFLGELLAPTMRGIAADVFREMQPKAEVSKPNAELQKTFD